MYVVLTCEFPTLKIGSLLILTVAADSESERSASIQTINSCKMSIDKSVQLSTIGDNGIFIECASQATSSFLQA
jgi:hypothetical protein